MVSARDLRDWLAVVWLLIGLAIPLRSHADGQDPGREPARATPRRFAKPLPESDGDAVRAHIGKRCTITLINGSTREGVVTDVQPGVWIWLATPSGRDEALSWRFIAAVAPVAAATRSEPVAPSEPQPGPPPSPDPLLAHKGERHAVHLKSGETTQGTVIDLVPGQWLKLRTFAGAEVTVPWADIRSLPELPDRAAPAAPETPAARSVPPQASTQASTQTSTQISTQISTQPPTRPSPAGANPALDAELIHWKKAVERAVQARIDGDAERADPRSHWSLRDGIQAGGTYRWSRLDSIGSGNFSFLLGMEKQRLLLAWVLGGELGRTGTGLVTGTLSVGMTVQGLVHRRVHVGAIVLAGPQIFARATHGSPLVSWDLQLGPSLLVDLVQSRGGSALFVNFRPAFEVTGLTGDGLVIALSVGVRIRGRSDER